jgi:hypothetical protein
MTEDLSSEVDEVLNELLPEQSSETTPQTIPPDTASEDTEEGTNDNNLDEDRGAIDEDLASVKGANRHREQLRNNLNKPAEPANIIIKVCSVADISDSVQKEARELIENADGALPIQRTRIVWTLAAIKHGSEVKDEPIEWQTLTRFTDMDKEELEVRAEQFSQID